MGITKWLNKDDCQIIHVVGNYTTGYTSFRLWFHNGMSGLMRENQERIPCRTLSNLSRSISVRQKSPSPSFL
jgi:hypothetical protein